jgi:hypothetical protein
MLIVKSLLNSASSAAQRVNKQSNSFRQQRPHHASKNFGHVPYRQQPSGLHPASQPSHRNAQPPSFRHSVRCEHPASVMEEMECSFAIHIRRCYHRTHPFCVIRHFFASTITDSMKVTRSQQRQEF